MCSLYSVCGIDISNLVFILIGRDIFSFDGGVLCSVNLLSLTTHLSWTKPNNTLIRIAVVVVAILIDIIDPVRVVALSRPQDTKYTP
ncbi:MAG: hypothetical protein IKL29_10175 [Bacteroidaceae bacterium]|nr:hypothetical protein [Bacteroidaceae bacterium]